jgi:hypothetical protein
MYWQIQQHVERALEGLEEYLQRLRRDVEIARQLGDGLSFDHGEWHLALRGRHGARRRRRGNFLHQLQLRFHR